MVSPENHLSQIQVGTNIRIIEPHQKIMVVTSAYDQTYFYAGTLKHNSEGVETIQGEGTVGPEDVAQVLPEIWSPERVIEAILRGYEHRFAKELINEMRSDITQNILAAAQMPPINIQLN